MQTFTDTLLTAIYHSISKKFKYIEFHPDKIIVMNGKESYTVTVKKSK